jgi:hypothetical protein
MSNLTTDVYTDNKFVRHLEPFELEMAKRDICFFYEEQKQWSTISGQLSFGYTFTLPYWDYLDLRGQINQDDKDLIRRGSLLLLLSECLEFFEDLGTYYLTDNEKLMSLKNSSKTFSSADKTEMEIKDLILKLVDKIEANDNNWEKTWEQFVNKLFVTEVYGHFRNKLMTFDNHWETLYLKYSVK